MLCLISLFDNSRIWLRLLLLLLYHVVGCPVPAGVDVVGYTLGSHLQTAKGLGADSKCWLVHQVSVGISYLGRALAVFEHLAPRVLRDKLFEVIDVSDSLRLKEDPSVVR